FGARDGATVAEMVPQRLGRRVLGRLVAAGAGGGQAAAPATREYVAAAPALSRGLAEHGSLTATARRLRGRSSGSAGTVVHSLAPTMAALPRTLQSRILAAGGLLRTGVEVVGIERSGERWQVLTGRDETLEADRLVLA